MYLPPNLEFNEPNCQTTNMVCGRMILFKKFFQVFAALLAIKHHDRLVKMQADAAAQTTGACDQDYSPCLCRYGNPTDETGIYVTCTTTATVAVMAVFNRTDAMELQYFALLNFKDGQDGIPDNLLVNKVTARLIIECGDFLPMYVSENAFNSTKGFSNSFEMSGCNLSNSSMSFLDGFSQLLSVTVDATSSMGLIFPSFPVRLPKLTTLTFSNGIGWNKLIRSPQPLKAEKLTKFYLTGSADMNDEAMDIVMNWAGISFKSTLESLNIISNNLTQIPRQIESFDQLSYVDLRGNSFSLVLTRSIVMKAVDIFLVSLSNCQISEIQPSAFQGNFKTNTLIELQGNKLTKIESSVFQEILRNGGTIDVKMNPFNCEDDPCHLAWVFSGDLLNQVKNAQCSNGTFFKDLDPSFFADYCYVLTTTESNLRTENSAERTGVQTISSSPFPSIGSSWSRVDEPSTFITEENWFENSRNASTINTGTTSQMTFPLQYSTSFDTTDRKTSELNFSLATAPLLSSCQNICPGFNLVVIYTMAIFFFI